MEGNLDDLNLETLLSSLENLFLHDKPESPPALEKADKMQGIFETISNKSRMSIAHTITRIYKEIMPQQDSSRDEVVKKILGLMPQQYSWPLMVVITIAAFAVIYSESLLVQHLETKSKPLAQRIALLKNKPNPETNSSKTDLLNTIMKLTRCLVKIEKLARSAADYVTQDSSEMKEATGLFPEASKWIIWSIVFLASAFVSSEVDSASVRLATASLSYKPSHLLETKLKICEELNERNKAEQSYEKLKRIMGTPQTVSKVLEEMICRPKEDRKLLYNGTRKTEEDLEVLKSKYVLLLISDLDVPRNELEVIIKHYKKQAQPHEYEVLWLPIVDQANSVDKDFHDLRDNMPWYSVDHPSLIQPAAVRYIRREWNFVRRPVLVVLDPQGKIINQDATPMMLIWGNAAFPFTIQNEESLWNNNSGNMDILADDIDQRLVQWIDEDKVICLYGGDEIDWIDNCNEWLGINAQYFRMPLKALYVGKSKPTEKLKECHKALEAKGEPCFPLKDNWFFWARLRSIWSSKKRMNVDVNKDEVMRAVMDIFTFDDTEKGWGVLWQGRRKEVATAGGHTMIRALIDVYIKKPEEFVGKLHSEICKIDKEKRPQCSCCID